MQYFTFDPQSNRLSRCAKLDGEFTSDSVTIVKAGSCLSFVIPAHVQPLDYFMRFLYQTLNQGKSGLASIDRILQSAGLL